MKMTDYEKFQEMVKSRILDYMPENYQDAAATILHLRKENDRLQAGLVIRRAGEKTAMSMDLISYYTRFQSGFTEVTLLKRIAEDYLRGCQAMAEISITPEKVLDYGQIKDRIQVQLVSREMNRERLQDCPHKLIDGTDLATMFCIKFYDKEGQEYGSASVTANHLELWDVTVDQLYETALKNTMEQMPAVIVSMDGLLDGTEEPRPPEEVVCEDGRMYILGNGGDNGGAAVILYPGVLRALAENSGFNFYVQPASTREVMLIADNGEVSPKELQYILMLANRGEIPPQEVLSDQVYYYDGKEQKISLVTMPEETREILREINAIQYGSFPEYDQER